MKRIFFILLVINFGSIKAQGLDDVVKFIKANPQKASVYLIEEGKTTVDYNSNQQMPLASAAKTIIAIEFAKQAAAKIIALTKKISVKDLNKYYIPNTDGGAHQNWLITINRKNTDSVTLLEVAKGMIKFSSNANTEYLQDFLGVKKINKNLISLGLKNHQPLYYFTAAALMTCLKPNDMEEKEWVAQLKAMPIEVYRKKCEEAHLKLKNDSSFIKKVDFKNLSLDIQKIWSDKLVASTTETYAKLMQKICDKNFEPATQEILESIMEWPMEYTGNKVQFSHLGQKGGSTSYVLTDAFYAETKSGNKLACAFFFNNLTTAENALMQKNFGLLEGSIITNKDFRVKFAEFLK